MFTIMAEAFAFHPSRRWHIFFTFICSLRTRVYIECSCQPSIRIHIWLFRIIFYLSVSPKTEVINSTVACSTNTEYHFNFFFSHIHRTVTFWVFSRMHRDVFSCSYQPEHIKLCMAKWSSTCRLSRRWHIDFSAFYCRRESWKRCHHRCCCRYKLST